VLFVPFIVMKIRCEVSLIDESGRMKPAEEGTISSMHVALVGKAVKTSDDASADQATWKLDEKYDSFKSALVVLKRFKRRRKVSPSKTLVSMQKVTFISVGVRGTAELKVTLLNSMRGMLLCPSMFCLEIILPSTSKCSTKIVLEGMPHCDAPIRLLESSFIS
jgi:hypothetical protein